MKKPAKKSPSHVMPGGKRMPGASHEAHEKMMAKKSGKKAGKKC